MKEFSLDQYQLFLDQIKKRFGTSQTFREVLRGSLLPEKFISLRHDVDRKPENALVLARLENERGLAATYYFRTKDHTFVPDIIREIEKMGHEIGYHYESLSDSRGDFQAAYIDFGAQLRRLREIAKIDTISMHGRPFLAYDNRDLWKSAEAKERLRSEFSILGEIYLAIDYRSIAYITDTGRSWMQSGSNLRDRVESGVSFEFRSGQALADFLGEGTHNRVILSTHPERWETSGSFRYRQQQLSDAAINLGKKVVRKISSVRSMKIFY